MPDLYLKDKNDVQKNPGLVTSAHWLNRTICSGLQILSVAEMTGLWSYRETETRLLIILGG